MTLKKLRKDEKLLNMQSNKIEAAIYKMNSKNGLSWRLISKFLKFLTPFRIMFGISCLSISFLLVSSLVISNIDKIMNSKCGFWCGYFIE